MAHDKFKRKLTTIFSADVAGYSRLMGEHEAATVQTLCLPQEKSHEFSIQSQRHTKRVPLAAFWDSRERLGFGSPYWHSRGSMNDIVTS